MSSFSGVSVLVPARNEERILPSTLPSVLRAASELSERVEVLVIAPGSSSVHADPPVLDPILRWVPTTTQGKFHALQAGAAAATGDIFVLIDADVIVEPGALAQLLRPIMSRTADVAAGRIDVLRQGRTPTQCLMERWSSISLTAWDLFRRAEPEFLWALPGAIYAIRRSFLPSTVLVPLVDDASIGLNAAENGATFAYVCDAVIRTAAPSTYPHWMRQKFRSRRGWAALKRFRPEDVAAFEKVFRPYLTLASIGEPTRWLMNGQDRLYRFGARTSLTLSPWVSDAWRPGRATSAAPALCPTEPPADHLLQNRLNLEES